jgi:hypothetical protein
MAITLAADELTDAEITDGIALGDISCAARLWVRLWPVALNAARELVGTADVPKLAAEALIGTIAVIAVGRGPRDDVKAFLREAVRELGGVDASSPAPYPGAWSPDVSTSPIMSSAFAGLPDLVQDLLWITVVGDRADQLIAEALDISTAAAGAVRVEALTTLQREHLAAHSDRADDPACRQAHAALAGAVEHPGAAGLPRETWMHLSACDWCTEAFHELVFSNAAIGALVDRAATARGAAPPTVEPEIEPETGPEIGPETEQVIGPETEQEIGPEIGMADDGGRIEPPATGPAPVDPPADPVPRRDVHAADAATPGNRRRRSRVLVWAVAAAGAGILTLIVAGHGADRSDPLQAGDPHTATPTRVAAPVPGVGEPSPTPTGHATAARGGSVVRPVRSTTHTPRAPRPGSSTSSSPTPATTPRPSASAPGSTPVETPTPTPSTSASPSPTPSPTSKPCDPLSALLGLC